MKQTRKTINRVVYFSFLLIILLIVGCEEEKPVPREYPRLTGTNVIHISDTGVTFSADLYSMGTEIPEEYGFLWDTGGELNYAGSERVILGKPVKTGVFTASIISGLFKNREYIVKPFVKTGEHIVYGPATTFMSLGSQAPVINGFYPDSAGWGDTIMISGKHFSKVALSNEVKLNQVRCFSFKSTDTTLYFILDPSINSFKNVISVNLAGNVNVFIKDTLILIRPRIIDFQPRQARWGDTITVTGEYLYPVVLSGNSIKIGPATCTRVGNFTGNMIKIKVPYEVLTIESNISVNINGIIASGPIPFTLLPPYYSFSPLKATWGNTISLYGRFNAITSRNTVFFNSIQATILTVTPTQMTVKVPSQLQDAESVIKYNVTPFNVVSSETFTLLPPVIRSILPVSGANNTTVTIKGKNFSTASSIVKFGTTTAQIISLNDSTIVTKVPAGVNGAVKISITSYSQSVTSEFDFLVTNPKISGVNPLTGTFNDEITVTGEYFVSPSGGTSVSIGGLGADIVSMTNSEIVVRIPVSMDSIPKAVTVIAGGNSTVSADKVTLSPPVVNSVTPEGFVSGQDIVITGENFNPDAEKNKVFWDGYSLQVKSSTKNEIVATWPEILPRGNHRIEVNTGGYKRYSQSYYNINSKFLRIPAPLITTNYSRGYYYGLYNFGAGIKNSGYIASPSMKKLYKFNPNDNSWTVLSAGYPHIFYEHFMAGSTVLEDTLYIIGGYNEDCRCIKAFSPGTNSWESYYTGNSGAPIAFALNNKVFWGLDIRSGDHYFYESDPQNSYIAVRKGDFPTVLPSSISSYFSLGEKGYVVFSNNQVWLFDPETLQWSRKADFPGNPRVFGISFILGGYAYYGTGKSLANHDVYDDIWRYDPSNDIWTMAARIPNARFSATAFTLNGKAYIGFGCKYVDNYPQDFFDFLEFDPDYPLE